MNMKAKLFALAVVSALATGCASYPRDAEQPPTLASFQSGVKGVKYNGQTYYKSDFKPDGTLRSIAEYDFMSESAPCVVAGRTPGTKALGLAPVGNTKFTFHCREVIRPGSGEFRLLMVGTKYECKTRVNNYGGSAIPAYADLASVCFGRRSAQVKRNEAVYMSVVAEQKAHQQTALTE